MKYLIVCAGLALVAGCTLPQTTVKSGASPPGLVVKGAPAGATLYVDGIVIGPAAQYDGKPNVLVVLDGVHQIEIRQGTTVIYHEKALVSSGETHTVTVVGGSAP